MLYTLKQYQKTVIELYEVPTSLMFKLTSAAIVERANEKNRDPLVFANEFAAKHNLKERETLTDEEMIKLVKEAFYRYDERESKYN